MWPVIPDSLATTLFMALRLATRKLGDEQECLHMFAFYGNIKLGLWTPYVQLVLNGLSRNRHVVVRRSGQQSSGDYFSGVRGLPLCSLSGRCRRGQLALFVWYRFFMRKP
ncbi:MULTISPECIES: DUF1405 domain-containing protein [Halobacteriales]|uniref:DUF1405 domain-containing protein n=1 Tax=Halobacteriales TaxID=2235 RepID=UPI0009DE0D4B